MPLKAKTYKLAWTYIAFSLIWTYLFWIPAAIISRRNPDWPGIFICHMAGGIGPMAASIYVVTINKEWKNFLNRIFKLRSLSLKLWSLILSPIVIAILSSLIIHHNVLISHDFLIAGAGYAILLLFFGPIPEELGWRGVLFHNLGRKSIVEAQIITALVWFVWHLPLFFIGGTFQSGIGFGTPGFFLWSLGLIFQSLIMGQLYFLTKESIASAILFHYFVNLSGEMVVKNYSYEILTTLIYGILAIILIVFFYRVPELE